jgi:phosphotransferase system  glucose/maltose/N-acetylglucosamine-specific IIC component
MEEPRRKNWVYLVAAILSGVGMTAMPLLGSVMGMAATASAFEKLEGSGIQDPKRLSEDIGQSLNFMLWGIGLGVVCMVLFVVFLVFAIREGRRFKGKQPPALTGGPGA